MKIFNILMACCMTILFFNCTSKQESETLEAPTKVVVSGTITNPTEGMVKIRAYRMPDEEPIVLGEATPDSLGNFSMSFDLDQPAEAFLSYNRETTGLFLHQEDDMKVTLNTAAFDESLKYEGKGALYNNYLASKFLLIEKMDEEMKDMYVMPFAEMKSLADSAKKVLDNHYQTILANQEVSAPFSNYEQTNLMASWAQKLASYPNYYKYYKKEDAVLPENYSDFWKEIPLQDDKLLVANSGRSLLDNYTYQLAKEETGSEDYAVQLNKQYELVQTMFTGNIKEYLTAKTVHYMISRVSIDEGQEKYEAYKNSNPNPQYFKVIDELYQRWANLAKGKVAPDFTYTSIDGKEVSLSSLKGKVVYVDVWATWCGPCRREFPFAKELKKKFEGNKDIVFLYVSVDDDVNAWEKMLKEDPEFKGLHLATRNGWDADIVKFYNISGIPRYMMIDKNGNIASANASRPSDETTLGKLEALLAEDATM